MVKTSKKPSAEGEKERKKHKKHKNKHKTHKEHKHKKRSKEKKEKRVESNSRHKHVEVTDDRKSMSFIEMNVKLPYPANAKQIDNVEDNYEIPVELMNSKSHAPETPNEYEKRQKMLRREIDPITGRTRLIRGTGEILEELVSKKRHLAINKESTIADGKYFQDKTIGRAK